MKKLTIIAILLTAFAFNSIAQSITNVRFEQLGKQIIINYDLSGEEGSTYTVKVFCSIDGGTTWGDPLQMVKGDVGESIKTGVNKSIYWDLLNEREKLTGEVIFKVVAESPLLLNTVEPKLDDIHKHNKHNIIGAISLFAVPNEADTKSTLYYSLKYVYCKSWGGYANIKIDNYGFPIIVIGVVKTIGKMSAFYFGPGLGIDSKLQLVPESGFILQFGNLTVDLGIGLYLNKGYNVEITENAFYKSTIFFNLGLGVNF